MLARLPFPPSRSRWLVLAIGLGLLGCAQPQPRDLDVLETPRAFSATGAEPLPSQWWLAFGDAALAACIEEGLAGNLGLREARARLDQARAIARREGAVRQPELDGEILLSRTEATGADGRSRLELGLAASYEIDLWNRLEAEIEVVTLEADARAADLMTAAISLSGGIAVLWIEIATLRDRLALIDAQIGTNRDVLQVLELRFRRGQTGAEDVLRQRQLVVAGEGDRAVAQGDLAVLEHQLAVLLGRPPGRAVGSEKAELPTLPPLPRTGVPAALVQRRPDLRASLLRVAAAEASVAEAIAATWPALRLGASVTSTADELSDLFKDWEASVLAALLQPLFDGGRRDAEIAAARAEVRALFAAHRGAVLIALSEVEEALIAEARGADALGHLLEQLSLAERVIRQARANYRNGVSDFLGVLDATRTQQRLEREVLNARRDLLLIRVALYRALAGDFALPADLDPERTTP